MIKPVYLDYAATTPVDPRVADVMQACLTMEGTFANPASRSHLYGWQAEEKVESARIQVSELLNCDPREVVWTSGATESNNLALKGVFEGFDYQGNGDNQGTGDSQGKLVTSIIEHKAVIDPANWLAGKGVDVSWLNPTPEGIITVDSVAAALDQDTRLVSVMHVNNETGVVNPIEEIGQLCRDKGILFHVDAAQSAGKLAIDVEKMNVDLLSLSAHKFYGPKGVGALYVRKAVQSQLSAIIHGGGHERGMRSGTLATHQLAGMGEAAAIALECLDSEPARIARYRDELWRGISDLPGIRLNGSIDNRVCGHLNICFHGVDGEQLMMTLREVALSSGSACTSASVDPSYVLKAMGLSDADAHSSLRLSLGRFTKEEEVAQVVEHIRKAVTQLQQLNTQRA